MTRLALLRAVRAVLEEADEPAALPEVSGAVVDSLGHLGSRLWLGPEVDHGTIAPLLQALDEAIRAEASS